MRMNSTNSHISLSHKAPPRSSERVVPKRYGKMLPRLYRNMNDNITVIRYPHINKMKLFMKNGLFKRAYGDQRSFCTSIVSCIALNFVLMIIPRKRSITNTHAMMMNAKNHCSTLSTLITRAFLVNCSCEFVVWLFESIVS